ncbi:Alpha-amylase family glycosyl hydrolase, catalytic domain-containing protein [[Mycoplasma] cavipharyngis]|uniref:alpha-amylase family glycosyl hydrolase n=1 Tax=[Mycoplasma] cavipharyngis TaxID=92757 RepID=UPI0037047ECC
MKDPLKNKIIYQIFPRSFKDANNDGDGDLLGIVSKLDYLQSLNIDIIWLCPIYQTNFIDAGYDVLDYYQIWQPFGTLADFQLLVQEAEKRNIKIMLDIVLNHTSNQHPWFQKAINDPNSQEHNYYIWSTKPYNTKSIFGGLAWEYVPSLKKFYFHLFTKEQPDLNWQAIETQQAMADVINYWYNLGVKYFRLDAIQHVHKEIVDHQLVHSFGTKMVQYLQSFINLVKKDKNDIYFIGEASGISPEKAIKYGLGKDKIADAFFNFSWWWIGWDKKQGRNGYDPNWTIADFVNDALVEYQHNEQIPSELMFNFLTNHDTARAISRWGDENVFWAESAKSFAMLQFILKGNIVICFGEEIGMINNFYQSRDQFRDFDVINSFALLVDQEKYYSEDELIKYHNINSRDHSRYPMQWDLSVNYGFNDGHKTWIKLGRHYQPITVAQQEEDDQSILNFYRKLIQIRKNLKYQPLLVGGKSNVSYLNNNLIKIVRTNNQQKLIGLINISKHQINDLEHFVYDQIILSSYSDNKPFAFVLRPYESIWFLATENHLNS